MTGGRKPVRVVFDAAGDDGALRGALQELSTGRWLAMRGLLHGTESWGQWSRRTQVLGAAAAGTDVVQAWRAEEPDSVAALVMHARVAAERAARARRVGHTRAQQLWWQAREAANLAAAASPDDPVPWICLLALAQLDENQLAPEHRAPAPDHQMLYPGPWGLLEEAHKRDPGNREAYHRMLQFMSGRSGGSVAHADFFVHWVVEWAPPGSPLLVLPLYVRHDRWREKHAHGAESLDTRLHWLKDSAVQNARQALEGWFEHATAGERSLLDLNYLAHALCGAQLFGDAARVFEAMGPYATPRPWIYHTADSDRQELAKREFLRVRELAFTHREPRAGPGRPRA